MRYVLWAMVLASLLIATAVVSRPLLPPDETRYFSVAWEEYVRGDHLVSHLNGEPYSHKPPLLFWLINLVWMFTDLASNVPRLIAPAAGVLCLPLTWQITRRLWPDSELTSRCAPVMLATTMLWMVFCHLTMFDTLLTLFTLLALLGVLRAAEGATTSGWLLAGFAMGLGVLSKGPVILVHVLPATVMAPWWSSTLRQRPVRWYLGCGVAVLLAAIIPLAWAIPSAASGGAAYREELLFGQTAGRMVNSFAHRQPFWWYLPWLPLCLMPWISFGAVWRGARSVTLDGGLRFLLSWAIGSLVILSLVSGKQIYYQLPILPACAMILARLATSAVGDVTRKDLAFAALGTIGMGFLPFAFNHVPALMKTPLTNLIADLGAVALIACGIPLLLPFGRIDRAVLRVATSAAVFFAVLLCSLSETVWDGFDVRPIAAFAARCDRPLAWYGNYHGQFNFAAAIERVQEVRTDDELKSWLIDHPSGATVIRLPRANSTDSELTQLLRRSDRVELEEPDRQRLSKLLSEQSDFPLADRNPQALYVQWIRRGLTVDPCILTTYGVPTASPQPVLPSENGALNGEP